MTDDLNSAPEEAPHQPETNGYPRYKYVILLVILALILGFVASRSFLPSKKSPPSTDKEALQGDMSMKLYYFDQHFSSKFGSTYRAQRARYQKRSKYRGAEYNKTAATNQYLIAVKRNPTAFNIRRLIIIETPTYRPWSIEQLDHVRRPDSSLGIKPHDYTPEMRMWTAIYVSKEKLKPAQVKAYDSMIGTLNLGWYAHLVRGELYDRADMKKQAASARDTAAQSAISTIFLLVLMALGFVFLILIGIGLDIYYLVMKLNGWPGAPNPIMELPTAERSRLSGYLLEAFVLYMVLFIGTSLLVSGFVIHGVRAGWFYPNPLVRTISDLVETLLWGILAVAYLVHRLRSAGWTLAKLGLKSHDLERDIRWGIAGYIGSMPLFVAMALISLVLTRFVKTQPNPVEDLLIGADGWGVRLMLLLMLSGTAPFFEELFFRGTLFTSFRSKWSLIPAILCSAAVFALLHPLPMGFLPIFTLGCSLSVLYYQRGSLIPNMIAHCIHNGLIFVFVTLITS